MSSILKILRRIGGTKVTPTSGEEGQLAIWKAGKTATDAASLYFHDGNQWVELIDTGGKTIKQAVTVGETAPASPAAGDHWYKPSTKALSVWDGAAWANVAFTNVANTFTQPQSIDVTSTSAALHIKQLGTGACLHIEDEANPDASPFLIDASGNVGMGTTDTSSAVNVKNKNAEMLTLIRDATFGASGAEAKINLGAMGGTTALLSAGIKGVLESANTGYMVLSTRDASGLQERVRIDTNGDFGVGTAPNGQARMRVEEKATGKRVADFYLGTTGVSRPVVRFGKFDKDSTTSNKFAEFLIDGASVGCGQINAAGPGNVAFGAFSDIRLKENIEDLPPQLAKICALRPVEFEYIASEGGGHQIGFIAQEVLKIYPDVVGQREDGMLTLTGFGKTETRLIKALQEAVSKIDALEARVAKLEARR